MRKLICGISLFICLGLPARAQNIVFNHLTVENGLSNNSIMAITQDGSGFMWLATRMGLNRYDGSHFKLYKYDSRDTTTLSYNDIYSLYCDSKQNLWVGTSAGLDKYDAKKDAFTRIHLKDRANLTVFSIHEDRKGRLWVGTTQGLYLLKDREKNRFQAITDHGFAGKVIRCVFEDSKGNVWIGTNNGLTKITGTNGATRYETFVHEPGKPGTLSSNYITAVAEDARHNIWVGTQNSGVNIYQQATGTFKSFVHSTGDAHSIINNNIRSIVGARDGKVYIGTQEGLAVLDPRNETFSSHTHNPGDKNALSQNSVYGLFEDRNGSIWVGTYFGGVNITHPYTTYFNTWQNNESSSSLSNNVVSSIVENEQHNLWIGTEGGGLNYFNRSTGLFNAYKNKLHDATSLGSNLVKVVYLDKDGNPWVGTHGGGLNVFDSHTQQFRRYLYIENDPASLSREVISLLEDKQGRFWVGTNNGIKLYHRKKLELVPDTGALYHSLPQLQATCFVEDAQNNIWIGSTTGFYVVKGNTIKQLSTGYVNCIRQDAKGNIWLGLFYDGLALYNRQTAQFRYYTTKEGLPTENVLGILDDNQNNLWLSTDKGLIKFNVARSVFQTYNVSDGLGGNQFNYNSYLKDSRGELFFGCYNGFTGFYPENIETNNNPSPLVFTGLKLFNAPVTINGEDQLLNQQITHTRKLVFSYDQDVFTIEFALLNFIRSDKNRYSYNLEGFDKTWNEVSTGSATYTNLPSGTYTFQVKGANNDGIWSQPAVMTIQVLPPIWRTWYAWCIYIIILGSIAFLIIRYFFLRAMLGKEEELHQIKLNFFTNVSHEIRTHLTLIMAPVERMLAENNKETFIGQQLTQVKRNASRLLHLVSELMDFRKAETNNLQLHVAQYNLVSFLQSIYDSLTELSIAKNITVTFSHNEADIPVYFDASQLEKVFLNLLTNAFKFTPNGGRIQVNIEQQKNNSVQISVTDNGRGIAPQYLDKLFNNFFQAADHGVQNTGYGIGLALSKHIVELHKGTITVYSEPAGNDKEGKTCFTVTLLQGNSHFTEDQPAPDTSSAELSAFTEQVTATSPTPVVSNTKTISEKTGTILIAEDNPELRKIIIETFAGTYHVLSCENGSQAWETAIENIPDIIVSDVMMPEIDGFSLCTKLKSDERSSHIPVILLTAKSSQNDQVSGLETGADMYITKPFSTKFLELAVRNTLASRERMRQQLARHLQEQSPAAGFECASEDVSNTVDKEFLNKVIVLVHEHMDNADFGVEMLSRKVGMSAPVLYRKINALTGMSVNDFIKSLRLKKAAELLSHGKHTVYEVAYSVGYNDRKYFSKEFKKKYGKTPSEWVNQ